MTLLAIMGCVLAAGVLASVVTLLLHRVVPVSARFAPELAVPMSAARLVTVFAIAFPTGVSIHEQLEDFEQGEEASLFEAEAIATLWRQATATPPRPESKQLQQAIVCYVKYCLDEEWPAMRRGSAEDLSDAPLERLFAAIPNDGSLAHLYEFNIVSEIAKYRTLRLACADNSLPAAIIVFLSLGLLALFATIFLESVRTPAWAHAAGMGIVTIVCGLIVGIMIILGHPFAPPLDIQPVQLEASFARITATAGEAAVSNCSSP